MYNDDYPMDTMNDQQLTTFERIGLLLMYLTSAVIAGSSLYYGVQWLIGD